MVLRSPLQMQLQLALLKNKKSDFHADLFFIHETLIETKRLLCWCCIIL
jgi:hypothetical protein